MTDALSWSQRRRRLIAYGQWEPWTDAQPIREHIRTQMRAGLGWERHARLAGVPGGTVSQLLYSKGGRPSTTRIRPGIAAKLLAVTANIDTLADDALVDATATRRRVGALMWVGYSERRIAAHTHPRCGDEVIRRAHRAQQVSVRTARAVRDVCNQLWDKPPPTGTTGDRISVAKAKAKARRLGYVPLAAWDDLDDPTATPNLGDTKRLTVADRLAEVRHLTALGESETQACARVGWKLDTLRDHTGHKQHRRSPGGEAA